MGINQQTFHKVALPVHCFQVEFEFGASAFMKGGKSENLEKKPL